MSLEEHQHQLDILAKTSHPEPFDTEKWRNKTKYPTWNSIRLGFVRQTSIPNPLKRLEYIKCYSLKSPSLLKTWQFYQIQLSKDLNEKTWNNSENYKMATVLEVIKKPIICKFFNDFTDHINKTNSAIVFNREPPPNILNYRDHKTILKKKIPSDTHWLKSSASAYESSGTRFYRNTTGIQSRPDETNQIWINDIVNLIN